MFWLAQNLDVNNIPYFTVENGFKQYIMTHDRFCYQASKIKRTRPHFIVSSVMFIRITFKGQQQIPFDGGHVKKSLIHRDQL